MRARRTPLVAWIAWGLAAAAAGVLVVAVRHHLSEAAGTNQPTADALTRAGGSTGQPLLGWRLVTAWQLDSIAVLVVLMLGAAYVTGVGLRARRGAEGPWPWQRTLSFFAGLAVVVFATCGSIAVYDQVLFTSHMAGHLALVMLAPSLMAFGGPLRLWTEAATPSTRRRLLRVLHGPVMSVVTSPPVALASYTLVIVGSHLTDLIDVIMRDTWVGQLEHLVYLVVGYQFFSLVVGDEPLRWRLSGPARWLLLAVGMAVDTFTGVILMMSSSAVYLTPAGFSVDALSDTHTGGAIMWFGGDAIMAVVMVLLVVAWLRRAERMVGDEPGWLEQSRRQAFAEHTGSELNSADELDETDSARESYNDWLAELNRKH